jgi:hypothetical protein
MVAHALQMQPKVRVIFNYSVFDSDNEVGKFCRVGRAGFAPLRHFAILDAERNLGDPEFEAAYAQSEIE